MVWSYQIATNEGLGGRFVVHCKDGDIEYVNDKYQITDPILTYWLQNCYEKNGIYPFRSI